MKTMQRIRVHRRRLPAGVVRRCDLLPLFRRSETKLAEALQQVGAVQVPGGWTLPPSLAKTSPTPGALHGSAVIDGRNADVMDTFDQRLADLVGRGGRASTRQPARGPLAGPRGCR